jgi:hypothetical protein
MGVIACDRAASYDRNMEKSEEKLAQVRLEVLVNRKRRAMLGVEPGEKLVAGVMHMHVEQIGLLSTVLKMFNVDARRKHDRWIRETVLGGVGDEVTMRVQGPGAHESVPTKCFPLPSKIRRDGEMKSAPGRNTDESDGYFASVRLDVLINGERHGVFGVETGGSFYVGVSLSHGTGGDDVRTDVMVFGKKSPSKRSLWERRSIPIGVGDEMTIGIIGPGYYEAPPAKPLPLV